MPTEGIDLAAVAAGLLAYAVAVLASTVLVFVLYRVNTRLTRHIDEASLLASGHRSIAIWLGAIVLSQALLLRHAVFPVMAIVRDLFLEPVSLGTALVVIGQCALIFVIIAVLAFGSVALAGWLFTRLTARIPEQEEIVKDNVAVAIFFAFVLLAITLILNEGIEDLSRSLIPYGRTGIIHIP